MSKLILNTYSPGYTNNVAVMKYKDSEPCYCGHCNNKIGLDVYLKIFNIIKTGTGKSENVQKYSVGVCPLCGAPIILNKENSNVLPAMREFGEISFLPKDVDILYNEMRDAYSVQAYTCCVISGRTLLANVAVEEGAEEDKSFKYYVNYLVDKYLPATKNKPWLDKVRELGNDSAHKTIIANKEQAKISLTFINAILKNIYEFPNSVSDGE